MSHAPPDAALLRSLLEEYAELTRVRINEYLRSWADDPRLFPLVSDYPMRGGRMLRSGLCIASARAFGARLEQAVDTAAAIELLHNAFLVHDDIEDEGEERRGRPTLHRLHGLANAINAGDALIVLGLEPLIHNRAALGASLALRILEETQRMARISVSGQALELAWRRENCVDLDDDDYFRMVLAKTCWYTTIHPLRVGALIGTHGRVDPDRFVRFGFFVGASFQIQDDLLNLVGDPARYGKEIDGDVWEGKRTLMLIRLLSRASEAERERLREILGRPRAGRGAPQVDWIRERMDAYGCIHYARQVAHGLVGAGLREFEQAYAGLAWTRDLAALEALAVWAIERA